MFGSRGQTVRAIRFVLRDYVLPEFLVLLSFVILDIKSLCHSLTQKVVDQNNLE